MSQYYHFYKFLLIFFSKCNQLVEKSIAYFATLPLNTRSIDWNAKSGKQRKKPHDIFDSYVSEKFDNTNIFKIALPCIFFSISMVLLAIQFFKKINTICFLYDEKFFIINAKISRFINNHRLLHDPGNMPIANTGRQIFRRGSCLNYGAQWRRHYNTIPLPAKASEKKFVHMLYKVLCIWIAKITERKPYIF